MNLATLKTVGVFAAVGAITGNMLATLIARPILAWYNAPGAGTVQTICNIEQMTQHIFGQIIQAQLIGTGIGAVIFIVAGVIFSSHRAAKKAAAAQA